MRTSNAHCKHDDPPGLLLRLAAQGDEDARRLMERLHGNQGVERRICRRAANQLFHLSRQLFWRFIEVIGVRFH